MTLFHGDCLEKLKEIAPGSVDMVLADLPYGTTACKWDEVIPFDSLWLEIERVSKETAALVFFGSEPFSSQLRISNLKRFKYDWIWDKVQPTGQLTAKIMPMKQHEIISVFYKSRPTYNRQMSDRAKRDIRLNSVRNKNNQTNKVSMDHVGGITHKYSSDYDPTKVNPKSILRFSKQPTRTKNLHPTQKPVELLEYLIKTYTNEGDTVLDPTMGSGSTGVACRKLNRRFIGIEKEKKYFDIAKERILRKEPGLIREFK